MRLPSPPSPTCRLLSLLALAAALAVSPTHAFPVLPPGFVAEDATPNDAFLDPTAMAFVGEQRFLVAEQRGVVWMVDQGVKLTTPVIDLSDEVLGAGDRGLLGLTVDPAFATNRYVYLLYTVEPDSSGTDLADDAFGRLTRYQMSATDPDLIDPATRTVLMGTTWADAPPSGSITHAIGCLRWGRDGSLLVSVGEGAQYVSVDEGGRDPGMFLPGRCDPMEDIGAFRAQYLNSLGGKVLRIDPATGHGYPSNPFWDGDPMSKRSRVWAYGTRNVFRFTVRPGTGAADPTLGQPGTLYLGDVGWEQWEEVDVARQGGLNFGWPCVEGFHANTRYQNATPAHTDCGSIGTPTNPSLPTAPLLDYNHGDTTGGSPPGYSGQAVLMGPFYTGVWYPPQYRGAFFYGDYGGDWIRWATVDSLDQLLSTQVFATSAGGSVDFALDPVNGDLYYLAVYTGTVFRVRYLPTGDAEERAPALALSNPWPNPARGGTRLSLDLPRAAEVAFAILDVQGREVWSAPPRAFAAGRATLAWDGTTAAGTFAAPGVYRARVRSGEARFERRFTLLR
jgi:glucose/arabinose dehydrogenase